MKNYVLPIVLSAIPAYAAALDTANGRVTDDNGEPLAGAIVNVKGSKVNAATDINGYFTLTLPDGLTEIHVTYIGMQAA
ncbi:MAG: carboxypeptidase-like regulatory domain-containing protein, partial [Muribaculaceae bacterium]|nr:carboxypeptidase-like regulatory domain-containing protein [Muribaculaceae bacterium]